MKETRRRRRIYLLTTILMLIASGPTAVDCAETSSGVSLGSCLDEEIALGDPRSAEIRYY